jgi:hypothetical protein
MATSLVSPAAAKGSFVRGNERRCERRWAGMMRLQIWDCTGNANQQWSLP